MSEASEASEASEPRGQASHLSDVVAVELGEGLAGAYCGRWLRLNGATVIKIEDATSGGDRLQDNRLRRGFGDTHRKGGKDGVGIHCQSVHLMHPGVGCHGHDGCPTDRWLE